MVEPGAPGQVPKEKGRPKGTGRLPGEGVPPERGRPASQGKPPTVGKLPGTPGQVPPGAPGQVPRGAPGTLLPDQENPWAPGPDTVPADQVEVPKGPPTSGA
jgi:hypothetical protein